MLKKIREWRERRLRERCVKYALRWRNDTHRPPLFLCHDFYLYITGRLDKNTWEALERG